MPTSGLLASSSVAAASEKSKPWERHSRHQNELQCSVFASSSSASLNQHSYVEIQSHHTAGDGGGLATAAHKRFFFVCFHFFLCLGFLFFTIFTTDTKGEEFVVVFLKK